MAFVMASAGLEMPLIYRTSESSLRSYDWRIAMISIISLFSLVVPNLTIHSYKESESVQTTVGIPSILRRYMTITRVVEIEIAMSTPAAIA
jgi:uncharacterized membrane protein